MYSPLYSQLRLKTLLKDPQLLQMMADLQYANNQYVSALAMYFETAAVKTDYFQVGCPADMVRLVLDIGWRGLRPCERRGK